MGIGSLLHNSNALSNHPIHSLKRDSEINQSRDFDKEDVGYLGIIHPPVSDDLTSISAASAGLVQSHMLSGMPLTSNYFRRAHKLQALNNVSTENNGLNSSIVEHNSGILDTSLNQSLA